MRKIYDFKVKDKDGNDFDLAQYDNKVLLVINSATKCGYTKQYDQLEAMYRELGHDSFEILDFPCNQFNNQAPADIEEIDEFCKLNYGTTFPRFAKIDVNGKNADPLYKWMREIKPKDEDKGAFSFKLKVGLINGVKEKDGVQWNFSKFLINRQGEVVGRYSSVALPEDIKKDVVALINS